MTPSPLWITINQAVKILGSSRRPVESRIQSGELQSKIIPSGKSGGPGKQYLVLQSEIEALHTEMHRYEIRVTPMGNMKVCTHCKHDLPLEAYLMVKGKPRAFCKACDYKKLKEWRATHKEKQRDTVRRRYWADPIKAREKSKQWMKLHYDKTKQRKKDYYKNATQAQKDLWNEHRRPKSRAYQRTLRDSLTEDQKRAINAKQYQSRKANGYFADYTKRNWGKLYAKQVRRRLGLLINTIQYEQIDRNEIIKRDGSICYLCGRQIKPENIVLDHVIPVSRKGPHTAANLKVACRTCNTRKGKKLLEELSWYPPSSH